MEKLYRNYYKCVRCDEEWEDVWDAMCDDRCPECDTSMTPFKSVELIEES